MKNIITAVTMQCFTKGFILFFVLIIGSESSPRGKLYPNELRSTTNNRLSGNAVPSSYVLKLVLGQDWVTTNQFSGTVTISLSISNITSNITEEGEEEEVTSFELHAKNLEITELTLTKSKSAVEVTYSADPETELITVISNSTSFEFGDGYELTIAYNGQLSDSTMVGFYKSTYLDKNGIKRYMAATQFEEIHARTAFPCFDEPEMKATFAVTITYPIGYFALSNAKAGTPKDDTTTNLQTTTFSKTPLLSTYLVAFIVADEPYFKCKTASQTTYKKLTPQVCSRNGYSDTTSQTALDAVSALYDILHIYTGYNLTKMAKLSLAAIPDFSPGAMENWGMLTFRESYLLWDENESSNYDQQNTITVIAHELSHQWFGDMVTLDWWSNVFLNEGFATFFEYYAAALYKTEWELEKQFVVEQLQTALVTDSLDTALPLSYDVDDADYGNRFDDISYNKGGSILRMVYNFLGDLNFKDGLKDYLTLKTESNANPEDLWSSFDPYAQEIIGSKALPANMSTVMENWTYKPGYPVVTVSKVGDDLVLSQEQFSLSGTSEETEWYIPLTYTLSDSPTNFENMDTKIWLSPGHGLNLTGIMAFVDWIIFNNQQAGYYRVSYDTTLWSEIVNTLRTNISVINEINRAQLVDDQVNFARAGRVSYDSLLDFLTFLKNDDSYYSWSAAFNGFSYLFQKTSNEDVRDALSTFILEQMEALNTSVPIDQENPDDQIYTLKQSLALTWACKLGDENCVTVTKQMFEDHKNGKSISRNLKSVVYCSALRNSDSITEDFRFLWQKYLNTQIATERVTILKSLGCANNGQIRRNYLSEALTDKIRRQDASYVFASVYSNNLDGVLEVLNFIYDNYGTMTTYFGRPTTLSSIINSVSEYIVTQNQYDRLEQITQLENLDASVKTSAVAALARAEASLEFTENLENNFKQRFKITTASATLFTNIAFVTISCLLFALLTFY